MEASQIITLLRNACNKLWNTTIWQMLMPVLLTQGNISWFVLEKRKKTYCTKHTHTHKEHIAYFVP